METSRKQAHPTKLPIGRIEITLDPSVEVKLFELDIATAEGIAHFEHRKKVKVFFSAIKPIALIKIYGPEVSRFKIITPFNYENTENVGASGHSEHSAKALGYKKGQYGSKKICDGLFKRLQEHAIIVFVPCKNTSLIIL